LHGHPSVEQTSSPPAACTCSLENWCSLGLTSSWVVVVVEAVDDVSCSWTGGDGFESLGETLLDSCAVVTASALVSSLCGEDGEGAEELTMVEEEEEEEESIVFDSDVTICNLRCLGIFSWFLPSEVEAKFNYLSMRAQLLFPY